MYFFETNAFAPIIRLFRKVCAFVYKTKFIFLEVVLSLDPPLCEVSSSTNTNIPIQSSSKKPAKCFIMIHNTGIKRNIGAILRIAAAFDADGVIFVGKKKSMQTFGAQGTQRRMRIHFFDTLREGVNYVRDELNCLLIGIEITPGALSLRDKPMPFYGNSCFVLGNEGTGLSAQDKEICDYFVYIPHAGPGVGSLNVSVAWAIVIYQFKMVWCNCEEADRYGEKYVVDYLAGYKKCGLDDC